MGSGLAILTVSVFWIKALSDLSALALWWEEFKRGKVVGTEVMAVQVTGTSLRQNAL
jgi:hypothetical protein